MKYVASDLKKLFGFTVLFATMTVLMIGTGSAVFADPDASPGATPSPAVVDSIVTVTVISIPPTFMDELIVYDTPTAPGDDGSCPNQIPSGVEAWRLVSNTDTTKSIRAFIPSILSSPTARIEVPFGTGVGSPVTVTATGGAFVTKDGTIPPTAAGLTSVQATWLEVGDTAGTPAPTTDRVGDYRIGVCGRENNLVYASAINYDVSSPFTIQEPVGGEIISVSTTALLLAGASTSALWLVPLVAVAAGAFAVLRFQVYRK